VSRPVEAEPGSTTRRKTAENVAPGSSINAKDNGSAVARPVPASSAHSRHRNQKVVVAVPAGTLQSSAWAYFREVREEIVDAMVAALSK
jgi:hypothetical protein